jgi:hypothetical protein
MTLRLFVVLEDFVRRLRAWPRRLVLRATGERVELLELHETGGRRRCLVELSGGRQVMVTEAELDSELAMRGLAVAVCGGLALAGALVGGSLSMEQGDGFIADVAVCAQAVRQVGDLRPL